MTRVPSKHTLAYHEPGRNEPCICGSGLKFKKCCINAYSSDASKQFRDTYNEGKFDIALTYARRHFTWYALCHKAHTVPMVEARHPGFHTILKIDIEALEELLDNIHLCYFKLGLSDKFPDVIEHVKNVIHDIRWDAKIAYTYALWNTVDNDNDEAAYDSLKTIDIETCQDPKILALYLQVTPCRHTLLESVDILDRILANTRSESYRLQYSVLKGIKYYMACQSEDGTAIIEEAIERFTQLPEEEKSSYGRLHLAHVLELYGKFKGRHELFEESKQNTLELIETAESANYSDSYKAGLYKLLGDCHEDLEDYSAAIQSYNASLEADSSELTKVFLSRSLCLSGDLNESRTLLVSINSDFLDDPGTFDLAISWSILAVKSLAKADLEEAKRRIKAVEATDPFFTQLRDGILIELLEAQPKSEPSRIRKFISSLSRYVILNPNFFGIGININRIIEDAESVTQDKSD